MLPWCGPRIAWTGFPLEFMVLPPIKRDESRWIRRQGLSRSVDYDVWVWAHALNGIRGDRKNKAVVVEWRYVFDIAYDCVM